MKNNRSVIKWLIMLVSMVAMVFLGQQQVTAQAATIDGSSYVTSAKVLNGPNFKVNSTINVEYHLEFGDTPLHSGDVISIPLPDNLKSSKSDTFNVTGPDGKTVIGTATVAKGGNTIEVTLNEKAEGLTDKVLDLKIATKYNDKKFGEQPVNFPNNITDQINIEPDLDNMTKKGTIQDDNTIKWSVVVNRQNLTMKNLEIADTIGPKQTMVPPVKVSEAYWVDDIVGGTYIRENTPVSADDYTVTYSDSGFNLKFKKPVEQMVVIDYTTKITDTSVIDDGYVFTNDAQMKWGAGTNGGPNLDNASGKVSTTSKNEGSGNGNAGNNGDTDVDENNEGKDDEDDINVEPDVNGDLDPDGTPDVDTDGGTETPEEEAEREAEEEAQANKQKPSKTPAKAKDTTKTATKHATVKHQAAKPAALVSHAKARHTTRGKLPQTNEQRNWAPITGAALLAGLVTVGVVRFHN
ncbi:MAG TPA: hypothetical protein H9875_01695 [Candidatus Levilactobacillus faecigallinarum]|uniref:LPXTG cell wall anchor domain-containing protein n=1 Tax=Candidatus Levilactobacillus faecigallinarum TaxID=2838638 RepID=A0A9D1QR75_9LACO|nr:hypothetical protein [Candidatus Levilactobacillus faecigallinarum]